MDEMIIKFIKKSSRGYVFVLAFSIVLIIVSLTGMVWISADRNRTIFGSEINKIESAIVEDEIILEKYQPELDAESSQLKAIALKYCRLSLGQIFVTKNLMDFGFLGFLFWNGFMSMMYLISFGVFTKKIESMVSK